MAQNYIRGAQVLEGFGIKLELLQQDKIEMLRVWRNDPKVQQFMAYREFISPEMQEKWFLKLNNGIDNLYYIINFKGTDIGMINIKNIDLNNRIGESGVIIYDDKALNKGIAYNAHILLLDYVFQNFGIESIIAHTLKENTRSSKFTIYLGYKLAPGQENIEHQLWTLSKQDYLCNENRISFIRRYSQKAKI